MCAEERGVVPLHKLLTNYKTDLLKHISSQSEVVFGGASHIHDYLHHFDAQELQARRVHFSLEDVHVEDRLSRGRGQLGLADSRKVGRKVEADFRPLCQVHSESQASEIQENEA